MRESILFKIEPLSLAGSARVVSEIVAVRESGEERFDLFAADSKGEPTGACLGHARLDRSSGIVEPSADEPD